MPSATVMDYAKLARDVYRQQSDPRALGTGFIAIDETKSANGLVARAYQGPDGRIVVAFAGTNDARDDFRADWNFTKLYNDPKTPIGRDIRTTVDRGFDRQKIAELPGGLAVQYREALAFVQKVMLENPTANIDVTGHSLGGGHAQLAAKVFGLDAATFDAPGARDLANNPAYARMAAEFEPKYALNPAAFRPGEMQNYVIKGTIVGDPIHTGPHIGGTQRERIASPLFRPPTQEQIDLAKQALGAIASGGLSRLGAAGLFPYFADALAGPHAPDRIVDGLSKQPQIADRPVGRERQLDTALAR